MKLPRGAFSLGKCYGLEHALQVDAQGFGKSVKIALWSKWPVRNRGWCEGSSFLVTRQQARKLVRLLLKTIDTAEALEHGTRLVRRHG